MRQLKTRGIILSCSNYKEVDKIFKIFTLEKGKIICFGKSLRSSNFSKRASSLDTLNYVNLLLNKSNDFYYIKECVVLDNFSKIKKNYKTLKEVISVFEIIDAVFGGEQEEEYSFKSLLTFLHLFNTSPKKSLIYNFVFNTFKQQGMLSEKNFLTYQSLLKNVDKISNIQEPVNLKKAIFKLDNFYKDMIKIVLEKQIISHTY